MVLLVVLVSTFLSLSFPVRFPGTVVPSPPPQVGRIYSEEEIAQKVLRAREEMAKAEEELERSGFPGLIRREWARSLPHVALAALLIICLVGRRARVVPVLFASLPLLVLMAVVEVRWPFLLTAFAVLILFMAIRVRRGIG